MENEETENPIVAATNEAFRENPEVATAILRNVTRSNRNSKQFDKSDSRNLIFHIEILSKMYEYYVKHINMSSIRLECQKNGRKKGEARCKSSLKVEPKQGSPVQIVTAEGYLFANFSLFSTCLYINSM